MMRPWSTCHVPFLCLAVQENSCWINARQLDTLQVGFWPISITILPRMQLLCFFQIARNIMLRYPSRRLALETTTAATAATNNYNRSHRPISRFKTMNQRLGHPSHVDPCFCSDVGASKGGVLKWIQILDDKE